MSDPKRYQPAVQCVEPSYQAQMIEPKVMEFSEGEYVRWDDYARLKEEFEAFMTTPTSRLLRAERKEVERLKAEIETVRQVAQDNKTETESTRIENARLKAEVKRLTQECKGRQAENSVLAISLAEMKSYIALKNAAKDGKPTE